MVKALLLLHVAPLWVLDLTSVDPSDFPRRTAVRSTARFNIIILLDCNLHMVGIMSFKPTSRRLTMNGHFPLYDGMEAVLAQPGPMAKCVDDLDVMMRVLIKYNPLDPLTPPVPAYPDINQVDVSKLRVGYFLSNKVFETCPAVKRSILNAVDLLRECGATVEEWDPIDLKEPAAVYVKLLFGDEGKQMIDTLKGSSVHPVSPTWTREFESNHHLGSQKDSERI